MSNADIAASGQQYIMNTYGRFPLSFVRGEGTRLWDADGKAYLDFVGGIAVCILGHCHPQLVTALKKQAETLWHVSNLYWIQPQINAAAKLVEGSGLDKVFFCNSGAEAVEAAIKLSRKYFYRQGQPQRNHIISFLQSFHGRTLAAVTATGQAKYQEGFAPLVEGFHYAEFNNLESVKNLISEKTAAILIEPVQGEGGIRPAKAGFLKGLRELCDSEGILLIFDEVQCGTGRTGNLFAYQNYGVKPDIVAIAKGLGGGFPIGAMLSSEQAASGFAPGDHASTFGGNPLATAVAEQVLNIISARPFLERVRQAGHILMDKLQAIADRRIVEVRGLGLMVGIEMSVEVSPIINRCMEKGLLLVGAGPKVVRMVPPLTVSDEEIEQAVSIFARVLEESAGS
ncbi:MAG: aspartate aminotransferase family protein [Syntrophomonadaceae bacterium]|jgi:acetylornithine/N-succinyldiaminopimelate aminotransferase|nr:aspartate aminotransferase family protein [Syntrophomonadaceae bacterium]